MTKLLEYIADNECIMRAFVPDGSDAISVRITKGGMHHFEAKIKLSDLRVEGYLIEWQDWVIQKSFNFFKTKS